MNEIELVRRRFAHARVALVGGVVRPSCLARLKAAFSLKEVIWLPTRQSDASSFAFESTISRKGPALVVALLGLVRHQHVRDLRSLCKARGIPLVLYWRTPNPNGLAAAIVRMLRLDE